MRHICLGISKSKMSPCWASEKVLLAMGIPAEGFKGDQDLDNGPAQGEERVTVRRVGLDPDQRDKGVGGSGAHSPLVPSTGASQEHPNPKG